MAKQDLLNLAEPEADFAELLKNFPTMPKNDDITFWKNMSLGRRDVVIKGLGPPPKGITEQDHQVKMRDGTNIVIRSYTPDKAPEGGSPLIVQFHGGGFCVGGLENETPTCRSLALELGAVVLNVEYRLAPEFKFPLPVNDAWDSVKWAAKNAYALRANPLNGFIVGGSSAGGNLASVCAHLARNERLSPPLTGQILSNAVLIPSDRVPEKYKDEYLSWHQNSENQFASLSMMEMFTKSYEPELGTSLYDTFNDPTGHADLPPAYLQASGSDILRDDSIIYERVLREDYKVPTRIDIYKGMPHMFWVFFPTFTTTLQWKEDIVNGVRWLLQQKK